MEHTNYAQILSERILCLRKEKGLTQESLAQRLGVSFQAVSKWENEQSCPDIALLPLLADIFGVPVDSLFGRATEAKKAGDGKPPAEPVTEPVFSYCNGLPWPDDQTLRGVVAWGHKLLWHGGAGSKKQFTFDAGEPAYTWLLRYSPLNVATGCNLHVEGDIRGSAAAKGEIRCSDIGGGANAGGGIECGDISGGVNAGGGIRCDVIGGGANAGGGIECGDISGDAGAGGAINCGDISGDAGAGGAINCNDIGGSATAKYLIHCARIEGDAKAKKIVMQSIAA